MKWLSPAALLPMFAVIVACATPDPARHYYGNTLFVVPANGVGAHYVYYHPDRTFDVVYPDRRYDGNYHFEGDQICLTGVRSTASEATTSCHLFDGDKRVGESWEETTSSGITYFSMIRGQSGS